MVNVTAVIGCRATTAFVDINDEPMTSDDDSSWQIDVATDGGEWTGVESTVQ